MSVRVGRIMRHEDVHGVSGTGDHIADVFEASDGTTVVRWLGANGSTNVYGGVKNVLNVHGHGGKTDIEWLWDQEPDADPMDAVFEKKILAAGGSAPTGATAPATPTTSVSSTGEAAVVDEAATNLAAEAQRLADEADEDAAAEAIAERLASKVVKKTLEKTAVKIATEESESSQAQDESAEE